MRINDISRGAYRIKLRLRGHREGDLELSKRQHLHTTTIINTAVTTTNNKTLLLQLLLLLITLLL